MEMGTLIFDIDGTICTQEQDYSKAKPFNHIIEKINKKYDEGYTITFFTARGSESGINWSNVTLNQLKEWQVKYHNLYFGKPAGLLYIDDKGININNWEPYIQCLSKTDKNWGCEYLLNYNNFYAMKRLEILKEKNISLQYHKDKHETWHIVEGYGTAVIDDDIMTVIPGDTVIIPPGVIHQVRADSDKLVIIESSTAQLNDINRLGYDFLCI